MVSLHTLITIIYSMCIYIMSYNQHVPCNTWKAATSTRYNPSRYISKHSTMGITNQNQVLKLVWFYIKDRKPHLQPIGSWERWYPIEKPLKRWNINRVVSLGEWIMEEACWDDTSLRVLEETSWETPSDRPVPDSRQVGCYLFGTSLCANPQGGAPHHIYNEFQVLPRCFLRVRNASQHKTLPHPGALCWPWHHSQTGSACWNCIFLLQTGN